jgi:hypothetical protein
MRLYQVLGFGLLTTVLTIGAIAYAVVWVAHNF